MEVFFQLTHLGKLSICNLLYCYLLASLLHKLEYKRRGNGELHPPMMDPFFRRLKNEVVSK
jgi:hypothetical protein